MRSMFPYRRAFVVVGLGTVVVALQACRKPKEESEPKYQHDEYYGDESTDAYVEDDEFVEGCLEVALQLVSRNPDHEGADFSGVDCSSQDLSHANLRRAKLRNANFSAADLSHADLSNVDLSGADLSGADLSHANLTNAILHNVDLSRADLSNAILDGAEILEVDIKLAVINPKYDWIFCEAAGECWSDDGGWEWDEECPPLEEENHDVDVVEDETDAGDGGSSLRHARLSCAAPGENDAGVPDDDDEQEEPSPEEDGSEEDGSEEDS